MARTEIISFRLTMAERAQLEALARRASLTLPTFCRKVLLDLAEQIEPSAAVRAAAQARGAK